MATFCTCAMLPNGTMQYACVRVACMRDAGVFATCPANVRGGDVECDPDQDTLCLSACTNNMRVACVCVDTGGPGSNSNWTCADQTMTCD
jgi:hypothetical protein